jgi:hypothetical protein
MRLRAERVDARTGAVAAIAEIAFVEDEPWI